MGKKNSDYVILFVDDEIEVAANMITVLESFDYKVISCSTGKEAIEMTKKLNVDIILMDYFMPNMNGEETIKEIRKFNKEVVIILQTAYSSEKPALEMISRLNIQGYHDKSTGVDELLLLTATAIKIREQAEEIKKAHSTIKTLKEDITLNVIAFLEKPLTSMLMSLDSIKDCSKYLRNELGNPKSLVVQHKTLDKIEQESNSSLKQRILIYGAKETLEEMLNTTLNFTFNFTIKELIKKIKSTAQYINRNKYYLNLNVNIKEDVVVFGNLNDIMNILNNLITKTFNAYGDNKGVLDLILNEDKDKNNIILELKDYAENHDRTIDLTDENIIKSFGKIENEENYISISIPMKIEETEKQLQGQT